MTRLGNSDRLFYESWEDAARDVVRAAGGMKTVAALLWANKPLTTATQRLTDCLNQTRDEKLSPDELLMLIRIGRDVKCHALMVFISADTAYSVPVPVEPEDEKARLMAEYVSAASMLKTLSDRLQKHGLA